MMKIFLTLFLVFGTTTLWACFLTKGEIKVNKDKLTIHQKFDRDQSYPFRTDNYLIHFKLLSLKKDEKQLAEVIIRHPKTYKVLGKLVIALEENKNVQSSMENGDGILINTDLTYQRI